MKLDPKPFETLFQQVIRLEKTTNELKVSIYKFLRSDKGLLSSRNLQDKVEKDPATYDPKTCPNL